jgi:hypothetical protein
MLRESRGGACLNMTDMKVGYRKPPKGSQFQEGKSGNSSGRPKQDPGIAAVFRKISKQKVRTNGPNGQQCMSKLEASVTQLVNQAASGDLRAMKVLMQMASRFPEQHRSLAERCYSSGG